MMMMIPMPRCCPPTKSCTVRALPSLLRYPVPLPPPAATATGPKKGLEYRPACLEVMSGDKRSWKIE